MVKLSYLVLAIVGGITIGLQAGVNGSLGKKVGTIEGTFISFFIGCLLLTLMVIFAGKGNLLKVTEVSKWELLGGVLGVIYLVIMVAIVPKIGVASSITSVIVGQLLISMTLDHFGIFTDQRIPFDWYRAAGIVLLLIGLFLIFRANLRPI